MFNKKNIALVILAVIISGNCSAMNLLRTLIRPPYKLDKTWNTSFMVEHGFDAQGYDEDGNRVNMLKIYNPTQNALKMLDGFPLDSRIGKLAIELRADGANDDGIRGHLDACGRLSFSSIAPFVRWQFMPSWFLTTYLPAHTMKFNSQFTDLTQNVSSGDFAVKQKLTNNFVANVFDLSGLYLGPWKRTGLGDLVVLLEWVNDFRQPKPLLRNVRVDWRVGMTFPTGLQEDENLMFAQPFGYDGAYTIIFGVGLGLNLGSYFRVGGDVELQHRFGNSGLDRIKVNREQTDFLYLQKAVAFSDYGLIQRFTLFGEFYNFYGLSLKVGYLFAKYGDDIYSVRSFNFSENIANTDSSLFESTGQTVVVSAGYDFGYLMCDDARAIPSISLFTRIPVQAKRVALNPTIGAIFSVDF
jgi:hypothetical protein